MAPPRLFAQSPQQKGVRTVAGGGETVDIIEDLHAADDFTWVSTGGGAMLALLAGEKLPGIEVLRA